MPAVTMSTARKLMPSVSMTPLTPVIAALSRCRASTKLSPSFTRAASSGRVETRLLPAIRSARSPCRFRPKKAERSRSPMDPLSPLTTASDVPSAIRFSRSLIAWSFFPT